MTSNSNNIRNEAVLRLESNSKAINTKRRYNCTNYKFILWLFERKDELVGVIKPQFMDGLVLANEKDLELVRGSTNLSKQKYIVGIISNGHQYLT